MFKQPSTWMAGTAPNQWVSNVPELAAAISLTEKSSLAVGRMPRSGSDVH